MRPTPAEINRLKRLTAERNYTIGEWMMALNLNSRNDPEQLERTAFLLNELKRMISSRKLWRT